MKKLLYAMIVLAGVFAFNIGSLPCCAEHHLEDKPVHVYIGDIKPGPHERKTWEMVSGPLPKKH